MSTKNRLIKHINNFIKNDREFCIQCQPIAEYYNIALYPVSIGDNTKYFHTSSLEKLVDSLDIMTNQEQKSIEDEDLL